jgi:hypothetical protein
LPDRIDVFTWSTPFLSEKVVQMLVHILKMTPDDDPAEVDLPS